MGNLGSLALYLAVLMSALAALHTTMFTWSRATLAMGAYGALPPFLRVDRRTLVPRNGPVLAGLITMVFYVFVTLVSEAR